MSPSFSTTATFYWLPLLPIQHLTLSTVTDNYTICPSVQFKAVLMRWSRCMRSCMYALIKGCQEVTPCWKVASIPPRRDLLRTERSQSLISGNLPGNHHPRHDLQVLQQGGSSSCGNVSELRDNLARAASNHVPTSNHSWLLVLYFPQVLKCWIRFSFFSTSLPWCIAAIHQRGWMHPTQGWSYGCTWTANMLKSWSETKCDPLIPLFMRFYIQIHVYLTGLGLGHVHFAILTHYALCL